MPVSTKFALYDFAGKPRAHYLVDEVDVPKPVLEPTVSHHVVIVDRSGSMYGVMDSTKSMVEKVMTVEEFQSSGLLLTLISYSSKGDFTVHFERTPVSDVLDPSKPHVAAIRDLHATCLTSVSGALNEALNHMVDTETTAVSVHTDGYFNDSSPAAEAKAVDAWIKKVAVKPNVFVNTISYGNCTDFKILDRIASSLSGKCIVAKDVKQVYTALHNTSAVLAGRVLPAIHIASEGAAFLAFHNVTQKKVNGAATGFSVKGVGPDDETRLFRFTKVDEAAWASASETEASGADLLPVYVFARILLGEQRLNDAKFALMATRDAALITRHYKALTAESLSALAEDLEARIGGATEDYKDIGAYGFGADKTSVLELCALLEKHKRDFTLDLDQTLMGYARRDVKRLVGKWTDGTFVPASTRLVPNDDVTRVSVLDMPGAAAFELSNAASTISMFVSRSADLYKNGEKVTTVAGRKVNPAQIRAYTLVGDGEINAESLYLNISSKKLHATLVAKGLLADEAFDHAKPYILDLTQMPACSFSETVAMPPEDTFNRLVELSIKRGIFLASLGGSAKADEWTAEQLEQLRAHDLTAALWYSPPTTNPYTDLNKSVSDGEIDSRTSFSVTLGDARMVSSKALYSANEYLARRFSVKVADADAADCDKEGFLKKPKFTDLRESKATVVLKTLSARTKLNAIDDATFPLFEQFLLGSGFDSVHVASTDEEKATLLATIEENIEALYAERIRPLAFYIGATGLVPEGWDVEVLDAEALSARFEGIDIEKKQADGTFLVSGNTVIGVFPEVAYFSTPLGVERVATIASSTEAA